MVLLRSGALRVRRDGDRYLPVRRARPGGWPATGEARVAGVHGSEGIPYLNEVAIFLVSSVVIVPICQRLKISPILGFLLVGIAVGPSGLALASNVEGIQVLAELGIVFLLFTIGLELSIERLKAMRRLVFGLGASQVFACTAAIGLVAYAWGNSIMAAAIIGVSLALSSTAMVLQLLVERGAITRRHGRVSFAILLFQDLAVVPVLILITVFGSSQDDEIARNLGLAAATAVLAIAGIVIFGRFAMHRIYRFVAAANSPETFLAVTLLMVLGVAVVTEMAGLSMALGAFLVGLLLSETEYRHQVDSDIAPFKGLLLGLFFISVGMSIDFNVVDRNAVWIAASLGGLILVKAVIIVLLALAFQLPRDVAIRAGLMLGAGGEFAFVILNAAMGAELLENSVGQFMIIVASLSMLVTPGLALIGDQLARPFMPRGQRLGPPGADLQDLEGHVIIAGFGRVGQTVADLLTRQKVEYVALDLDASRIWRSRQRGLPVYFGDATRRDVLSKVGADRAAAVLITLDDQNAANLTVHALQSIREGLPLIARAADAEHARALKAVGADFIVLETLEASLQLAGTVLRTVGTPRDKASALIEKVRDEQYDGIPDWRVPYAASGVRTAPAGDKPGDKKDGDG